MSKKTVFAVVAAVAMAIPSAASAQSIGVGARVGTLGIGGEAAVGLGSILAVRGGIGSGSFDADITVDNNKYTVGFPDRIWNIGVDLYPGLGGLHISAGFLHRPKFDVNGAFSGTTQIGNNTYNGDITFTAEMKNEKETGPFLGLGFGRTAKHGLGFSLDLGAAVLGDGKVTVTNYTCNSGGTDCKAQIQSDVEAERAKIETEINDKGYAKVHPILSFSLHYGL